MPVFMVSVNSYGADGLKRPIPELVGVMTPVRDADIALAMTLLGEEGVIRDVEVEQLSRSNGCWYVMGSETRQ